jgi:hypothetical protein
MIGLARHPDRSDIRIGNHVRVGGGDTTDSSLERTDSSETGYTVGRLD